MTPPILSANGQSRTKIVDTLLSKISDGSELNCPSSAIMLINTLGFY